jgi:outer membrane protein assembly factor BamB
LAIDIKDGNLRWKKGFAVFYINRGLVVGEGGEVYFLAGCILPDEDISQDVCLLALDNNGQEIWVYGIEKGETYYDFQLPDEISSTELGWTSISKPVLDKEGTIYFGYNNILFSINPDGTEKWQKAFETECKFYNCQSKVNSLSIANDETIYVGVADEIDFVGLTDAGVLSCFHALNLENPEEERWPKKCTRFTISMPLPISPQGNIYISFIWNTFTGSIKTAIDGFDSQGNHLLNWPVVFENVGGVNSIIIDKEEFVYVLFQYFINIVKAFSPDGQEKWSFSLEGGAGQNLCLGADGTLFISGSQKLYLVRP